MAVTTVTRQQHVSVIRRFFLKGIGILFVSSLSLSLYAAYGWRKQGFEVTVLQFEVRPGF